MLSLNGANAPAMTTSFPSNGSMASVGSARGASNGSMASLGAARGGNSTVGSNDYVSLNSTLSSGGGGGTGQYNAIPAMSTMPGLSTTAYVHMTPPPPPPSYS